jgi:hypothetical protein
VSARPLTRRRLLAGTAAAAAGAALALPARAQAASPAGITAPGTRLLGNGIFPIGLWWPPPPEFTTRARYREIADAGFTFVTAGDGVADMPLNATMLDAADHAGLLALPSDSRVSGFPSATQAQRRAILADYVDHRSFAGFFLADEPNTAAFGGLAAIEQALHASAPTAVPYVNLFPNYANAGQLGAPSYDDYLADYLRAVPAPFLSYDFYPFGSDGSTSPGYFANWASVRAASLRADIPAWIFIQAMDFPGRRRPNEAELRWQINASLAYGGTGIQYFCYWSPGSPFGAGLLTRDGQRTPLYDVASRINREYLQPVGAQLLPLVSESVEHANESPLPAGATAFSPDDYVQAITGAAIIVGRFRARHRADGTRWLLLANRSHSEAAQANVRFGDRVGAVLRFDPTTSRYQPVDGGAGPGGVTVALAAGDAQLYLLAART